MNALLNVDNERNINREAGFTLIEILVALIISGLCLVMLSGIVTRLTTAQRIVQDHAAVLNESDAVFRLIGGLVGSIETELKDPETTNIQGTAERLDVHAQGPAALGLTVETTFSVHLVPTGGRGGATPGALALAWINPDDHALVDSLIASDVILFQLSYQAKGARGVWEDSWSGRVEDLSLVRVTIAFATDRSSTSKSAIFAVHGRLPQQCVVDPAAGRCLPW